VTLLILGAAIVGFRYVTHAQDWVWTPRLLWIAGVLLASGPIIVVWVAARLPPALVPLTLLLSLATPAMAASTRCLTDHERTLNRWHTVGADGPRAIHTWNQTLSRRESLVTPPPGKTCTGRLHPHRQQVEVRRR
jgi:hypothetical protein